MRAFKHTSGGLSHRNEKLHGVHDIPNDAHTTSNSPDLACSVRSRTDDDNIIVGGPAVSFVRMHLVRGLIRTKFLQSFSNRRREVTRMQLGLLLFLVSGADEEQPPSQQKQFWT